MVKPKLVGSLEPSYRAVHFFFETTDWQDQSWRRTAVKNLTTVHDTVFVCVAKIGLRVLLQIREADLGNFEHWRDEFRK